MTSDGSFFSDMFSGVEKLAWAAIVCSSEGRPVAEMGGWTPSPRVFLRKDVILWELSATKMQGCDFRGVTGFGATLTKDDSADYLICQ